MSLIILNTRVIVTAQKMKLFLGKRKERERAGEKEID